MVVLSLNLEQIFQHPRRPSSKKTFFISMANLCHQIKIRIPGILYRMHGRCCILFEAKSIVSWIIGGSESSSLSIVPNQVYIVQGCQGFFRGCRSPGGSRISFPFFSLKKKGKKKTLRQRPKWPYGRRWTPPPPSHTHTLEHTLEHTGTHRRSA